jgi:hypothetical protein
VLEGGGGTYFEVEGYGGFDEEGGGIDGYPEPPHAETVPNRARSESECFILLQLSNGLRIGLSAKVMSEKRLI